MSDKEIFRKFLFFFDYCFIHKKLWKVKIVVLCFVVLFYIFKVAAPLASSLLLNYTFHCTHFLYEAQRVTNKKNKTNSTKWFIFGSVKNRESANVQSKIYNVQAIVKSSFGGLKWLRKKFPIYQFAMRIK